MNFCLIVVIGLIFIYRVKGFGINLIKVPEDDLSQVLCTMALLQKYFRSGEFLSGSVLSVSISSASLHIQKRLLEAMHSNAENMWTVVVNDALKKGSSYMGPQILHEKPQCYFVVIENLEDEDFDDIFEDWKTTVNWNPLAQFVVYLSSVEETDEEMTELVIEILLTFMNKKIYNVNVIGQSEETGYYYGKTVFPYHPDNNCGNRVIAIETLDICEYQDDDAVNGDKYYYEEIGKDNDHYQDEYAEDEIQTSSNQDNGFYNPKERSITATDVLANSTGELCKINDNISCEVNIRGNNNKLKYFDFDKYAQVKNESSQHSKFYLQEIYRALFLDKFPKDLSGCPLVAAFRSWEPYIFSKSEEAEEQYQSYEEYDGVTDDLEVNSASSKLTGIEYNMVQTIGELLHISIDVQVESNNLYLLFQQLIDGDIELVIGGIDEDPSISQFVSSTIPYHQDDLTWCVAKAKRKYSLMNFVENFQVGTWILTLTFILTASINIFLIRRFLNVRIVPLDGIFGAGIRILGIILNQSLQLNYIPTPLKLVLGTAFFMGLMFTNIYQSLLVSTLTTPKDSYQISHVEEIYRHRMKIMGSVENVRHLNKDGEIFKYIRETFQMCYKIEECLIQATTDERLAVAVSRQHFFYNPRIPRDDLYCFGRDENLYMYLVTMLLPKKFHLLHKINPVIQHIIESGHIQKWARDLDMKRKIQEEIRRSRVETLKSITLGQTAGCFIFSGILLCTALLIYLLEHWVHWVVVKRQTRLKVFRFMHRNLY